MDRSESYWEFHSENVSMPLSGILVAQELEIRSEMHVKMAQTDYHIRRAEGAFDSPYRMIDLGHFNLYF